MMQTPKVGNPMGVMLCKALGLNPSHVLELTLHVTEGDATVTIRQTVPDGAEVTGKYRLELIDEV